jgi:hypothetical protein
MSYLSKCSFGMSELDYLGHTVLGNGVSMDKGKVQVVLDWPTPKNVKQLRGFLGLWLLPPIHQTLLFYCFTAGQFTQKGVF